MASDKLFGRFDDHVRLVIGFVLTGLVGTYLSQSYTTRQANLVAAQKVFSDQSALLARRYFAMNQIAIAYQDNRKAPDTWKADDLAERWQAYRAILQEWNAARGFNREMIRLYFGDALWNEERDIHYQFRAWGQALETEHAHPGAVDLSCLDAKVDELLSLLHSFQFQMATAIQAGHVGPSRDQSAAAPEPRPDVPCVRAAPG